MKYITVIFFALLMSGCSTHLTKVNYEGEGFSAVESGQVIGDVVVSDERGTDANWLGAIRGGYGNRLKTLRTDVPTDQAVEKMYRDALNKSNLLSDSMSSPFTLRVVINKFDCSYYFNREAHAYVNVSIVDSATANVVFSKMYKTDEVESGVGAGIFGSVETLRDLAEKAMNKTIDKTLSDRDFINALASSEEGGVSGRLSKLEKLYENRVIGEKEYRELRFGILSDI